MGKGTGDAAAGMCMGEGAGECAGGVMAEGTTGAAAATGDAVRGDGVCAGPGRGDGAPDCKKCAMEVDRVNAHEQQRHSAAQPLHWRLFRQQGCKNAHT